MEDCSEPSSLVSQFILEEQEQCRHEHLKAFHVKHKDEKFGIWKIWKSDDESDDKSDDKRDDESDDDQQQNNNKKTTTSN